MIGDALDSGMLTVGAAAGLLVAATAFGAGYARIMSRLEQLTDAVKGLGRRLDKHEDAAQDHRHDDATRFQVTEVRLGKIEQVLAMDLTPAPIDQRRDRDTDRHRSLRGDTPRPRRREDTGESGSGET